MAATADGGGAGRANPGAAGAVHAEREWIGGQAPQRPSLGAALGAVWNEFRGLVREHALLAVLEAQRAGISFAYLIAAVLVIAVLVVSAWLAVVTALILWLAGTGVSWPWVLLIGALINVLGAVAIGLWARKQALHMPFSATLRQFSADRSDLIAGDHDAPAR
jgi:uncharacterized membrane protein YqjE